MQVFGFGVAELLYLFLLQDAGGTELMGDESYLGEVLDGLHSLEGFEQGAAVGDCAVVGHEDGVVMGNVWGEAGGHLACSGGGVFGEGNWAEGHHGFLTEHLVQAAAYAGEGGGDGRVRVNDGGDIFAAVVDGKMHADLAGDFPRSGELSAVEIDDDHVICLEQEFAGPGWGDEEAFLIQPDGQVSGCSGHETEAVEELAV